MNIRRLFVIAILLPALAGAAFAQDALKTLTRRIASEVATFQYGFVTTNSETPFSGSGKASVSGSCYRIEGNGLDIRCDGKSRWTADPSASEMVIEEADGETFDFLSNPALLLSDLDANFRVEIVDSEGGDTLVYHLTPIKDPSIKDLALTLVKGLPAAARLSMKSDGSVINFTVAAFEFSRTAPAFSFSDAEVSAYKNVTDLR